MLTWAEVIKFANEGNPAPDRRVEKTPEEWRALLTPEQYAITRAKGTERAFSHPYYQEKREGMYNCVCCGAPPVQLRNEVWFRERLAELLRPGK